MATSRAPSRPARARSLRLVACAATGCVFAAGVAVASGPPAVAAVSAPSAQSVGRFVDGALGTTPLQQVVDLKDARAMVPGNVSAQNPLEVSAAGAVNVPLTGALQLPQLLGINLGAANQVAVAKADGYSYGASGAVSNAGGASIAGNSAAYPADGTINLSAAAVPNNGLPGFGGLNALGSVQASIGAVQALAQTPAGFGQPGTTSYGIAGFDLVLSSPALASVLTPVFTALGGLAAAGGGATGCPMTTGIPDLTMLGGGLIISGSAHTVTLADGKSVALQPGDVVIDFGAMLKQLGLDLNTLPANTDLMALLANYLSGSAGLATALPAAVNSVISPLQQQFVACAPAALQPAVQLLTGAGTALNTAVAGLANGLAGAGGGNPLAPLTAGLAQVLDVGVNVQPNGAKGTFTSSLRATPDQATPVVPGQTIVRAIELNVGGTGAALALANAAAGPSTAPPATVAPTASQLGIDAVQAAVPTGVPAGYDKQPSVPAAPLVLLIVGLVLAGGGALAWRLRGTRLH